MAFSPGTVLNHYRVVGVLGAGGMGEVYDAEDTRLKRRVAIKVLPAHATDDRDRYARFEREAQALASLNHPNIVTIYSVEESGGTRFITMERTEGRTLDRLIPRRGLPLGEFLRLAIPLVDAVSAAHDRGIVHRDLKPSNVMVTPDGRVKVLDFGLAKLVARDSHPDALMMTTTMGDSGEGRLLGTVAYMSPEQAGGRPVDHRSDIFALGILLCEMAAGARPFSGDSNIAVISSIIKDAPKPPIEMNSAVPVELDRAIQRCLAKHPRDRFQSAKDLRAELHYLERRESTAPSATRHGLRRPRQTYTVVAALSIAATIAVYLAIRSAGRDGLPELGAPTFTRVTSDPGQESWPNLSPDGTWLVYAATESGNWDIYSKGLGEESARNLTNHAADDIMPAFSPDGRLIAFRSERDGGGIFVMTRSGESLRRLTHGGFDPAWSPDGTQVFYGTEAGRDPDARFRPGELWAVYVQTEQTRRIAPVDGVAPRVSPDGRLVAYWSLPVHTDGKTFAGANRDIWIRPAGGGDAARVTDAEGLDWNPTWAPDGRSLLFSSDRGGTVNLWRVAIDPASGRPSGDPQPLTTPALWAGYMNVSRDGAAIAYAAYDYTANVASIAFNPDGGVVEGEAAVIIAGSRAWVQPDVSPDGRMLTLRSARSQEDIYIVGTDGAGLRPITSDPALDRLPRWSPDARSIVFYSARSAGYQLWSVNPDGSALRQLTHESAYGLQYPTPSPDGRWLGASDPSTRAQFILDARDFSKSPTRLPAPPKSLSAVYLHDWSPDGTQIAAHESPAGGLWVYYVDERRWDRIGNDGIYPRWLPDGQRVLAPNGGRIVLVDTRTKEVRDVYADPGRRIRDLALSPDARRLYFTSSVNRADVWVMRFGRSRP